MPQDMHKERRLQGSNVGKQLCSKVPKGLQDSIRLTDFHMRTGRATLWSQFLAGSAIFYPREAVERGYLPPGMKRITHNKRLGFPSITSWRSLKAKCKSATRTATSPTSSAAIRASAPRATARAGTRPGAFNGVAPKGSESWPPRSSGRLTACFTTPIWRCSWTRIRGAA